jgi:serine phosphatase RsbU (regulator of sigma subunit)
MPRPPWSLLLFTDGAVEGFAGADTDERLGVDGFIDVLRHNGDVRAPDDPGALLDAAIAEVTRLNGGPLSDDVALLLLSIAGPDGGAEA